MGEVEAHDTGAERHRSGLWIWALVLPVLYVLSLGPATLLEEKGVLPEYAVLLFYKPLEWVSHYVPGTAEFLNWYLHFWGTGY